MKQSIKKCMHITNNLLFRIMASAQLLKKSDKLDEKDKEKIEIILESAKEIAKSIEVLSEDFNLRL